MFTVIRARAGEEAGVHGDSAARAYPRARQRHGRERVGHRASGAILGRARRHRGDWSRRASRTVGGSVFQDAAHHDSVADRGAR